ncbi:MAG: helix-turn-helix transcriptional regulator [Robiginitomaculum sp.]|nr:helix-turn-helix transcriptional regulator [Robiginitomaculum sp.]
MGWSDLLEEKSSLAMALDLVGDRWTLMLLSGCYSGMCKFNQMERFLGINRNLLSTRLEKLVEAGLLEKRLYNEFPPRYEYKITEISMELRPVIVGLGAWSARHFTKDKAPFTNVHKDCGGVVDILMKCENCDDAIYSVDIFTRLNPGAGVEAAKLFARMFPTE